MIRSLDSLVISMGDFYLLSTVLLAIALAVGAALRQPARRLAMIKATLVALGILAALCALPRWSVVHLRTAEQFSTASSANPQAAAFTAASNLNEITNSPTNNGAAPLPPTRPSSDATTAWAAMNEITWQRGLVVAYVAGTAGVFVWLGIGQLAAIRLRRQAQPAPAELIAILEEVATRGRVSPRLGCNEHAKPTEEAPHSSTPTPLAASSAKTGLRDQVASTEESPRRELESASRRDAATWSSLSETRMDGFGDTSLPGLELLVSAHIAAPVALGIRQPTIILPRNWLSQLPLPDREGLGEGSAAPSANAPSPCPLPKGEGFYSAAHLRSILAHELAHIRNHDLAWLAASRVLLVLLWAQPLYWLLRRRMRFDQETLADAAAAELTTRQHYAEQLVAWARTLSTQPRPMRLSPAVGLWEGASQLRQRVAMLVNANFTVLRTCSQNWRISASVTAIASGLLLSTVTIQPANHAAAQSAPVTSDTPTEPSTTVTVASEPSARERLIPNAIIGRAVDEKNQPIAGAEVFLFRINHVTLARKLVEKKVTDDDGEFEFKDVIDIPKEFPNGTLSPMNPLDPELVQVYVRAPGRATESRMQLRQQIARAGDFAEVKLLPAATLTGRVTGPNGQPVAGALVSVGGLGYYLWEGAKSVRTDTDGKYEIKDAASFDLQEFQKQQAEQRHQTRSSFSLFVAAPVLAVEHPDFATKYTSYEKIPGTQDLQLEPAAIIEGRVVFADGTKPAVGAVIHAWTSKPRNNPPNVVQPFSQHRADARADSNGKYQVTSLPAGSYDLLAEMPDWVNVGIEGFVAAGGQTQTAPDLVLTRGGIIRIRVVDDVTGKPIELRPNMFAEIVAQEIPFRDGNRTASNPLATANSEGRFELRTAPGKRGVFVFSVSLNDKLIWLAEPGPVGAAQPAAVIDVKEGQTVQVDVPVVDAKEHARRQTTGSVQVLPKLPPQDCIKQQTAILEKDPNNVDALFVRAEAWLRLRDERNALADYERLLRLNVQFPKNISVFNNVAYVLATSTEDNLRNGKRAVELAEKANRLLPAPSPDSLDTLAAAYAEAGDFDRAIRTQKEAIDLAEDNRRDQFREPLKLYEAHKPRREKAK